LDLAQTIAQVADGAGLNCALLMSPEGVDPSDATSAANPAVALNGESAPLVKAIADNVELQRQLICLDIALEAAILDQPDQYGPWRNKLRDLYSRMVDRDLVLSGLEEGTEEPI
jgi:hypothetical protein